MWIWLLAAVAVALSAVAAWAVKFALKERTRRKGRPWPDRSPVLLGSPQDIDPVFTPGPLGYGRETEVALIGDTGGTATTSETEAWILCVLARRSKRIFEFGTCTGRTAYLLARNAPADAEVITITLSPESVGQYAPDDTDTGSARWAEIAARESVYADFYYERTDVAPKVRQLIGDSKAFDEALYEGSCDLIFVDGSHAYSYVKSDSEKALRMARPGGIVVWHDFSPACPGVWRYLNEIGRTRELIHIRGTRLAVTKA